MVGLGRVRPSGGSARRESECKESQRWKSGTKWLEHFHQWIRMELQTVGPFGSEW